MCRAVSLLEQLQYGPADTVAHKLRSCCCCCCSRMLALVPNLAPAAPHLCAVTQGKNHVARAVHAAPRPLEQDGEVGRIEWAWSAAGTAGREQAACSAGGLWLQHRSCLSTWAFFAAMCTCCCLPHMLRTQPCCARSQARGSECQPSTSPAQGAQSESQAEKAEELQVCSAGGGRGPWFWWILHSARSILPAQVMLNWWAEFAPAHANAG